MAAPISNPGTNDSTLGAVACCPCVLAKREALTPHVTRGRIGAGASRHPELLGKGSGIEVALSRRHAGESSFGPHGGPLKTRTATQRIALTRGPALELVASRQATLELRDISVIGLGYVGSIASACLARDGHRVIGVDSNAIKVGSIQGGRGPVIEAGLDELIARTVAGGQLTATDDTAAAVASSEITFICVGTPSNDNGSLKTDHVVRVCEEIGRALRRKQEFHVVVVRSTLLPGTTRQQLVPVLEKTSGKKAGVDFGVCFHPEFLREGTAISDYAAPPFIVLAASDEKSAALVGGLYARFETRVTRAGFEAAEMVKYASNTWHALKVAFANEIGTLCRAHDIDSHTVMDIFAKDTLLNISARYLKPGFAFGGSCLPKDVRALAYRARHLDLELPLLQNLLESNQAHVRRAVKLIEAQGTRRIGVLGLSFKSGTDDLRESPMLTVVEVLLGRGYDVRIYDRNVRVSGLLGANREYLLGAIPHIHRLMVETPEELFSHAQTLVLGNREPSFIGLLEGAGERRVVDLVRLFETPPKRTTYVGIGW
jgi:GDP-mannose 6-dehydrogenase